MRKNRETGSVEACAQGFVEQLVEQLWNETRLNSMDCHESIHSQVIETIQGGGEAGRVLAGLVLTIIVAFERRYVDMRACARLASLQQSA